jgi:hypothetical protein
MKKKVLKTLGVAFAVFVPFGIPILAAYFYLKAKKDKKDKKAED